MAWLVCILESPTSNTAGIEWREYVNRNRPDVQGEIMDFVDKYRKDLYAKTASVDDLNYNNEDDNDE